MVGGGERGEQARRELEHVFRELPVQPSLQAPSVPTEAAAAAARATLKRAKSANDADQFLLASTATSIVGAWADRWNKSTGAKEGQRTPPPLVFLVRQRL